MSGMAARATGNREALEQPQQQAPPRQRDSDEDQPDRQVLAERGLNAEQRQHQKLSDDGKDLAHDDIGRGFDQRHGARLRHTAASFAS